MTDIQDPGGRNKAHATKYGVSFIPLQVFLKWLGVGNTAVSRKQTLPSIVNQWLPWYTWPLMRARAGSRVGVAQGPTDCEEG